MRMEKCPWHEIIIPQKKEIIFVPHLHCKNEHFVEDCANPCSARNEAMRENSHANIWAIIIHLLLPLRTSTVAELGTLFYSDLLEKAND